MIKNYDELLAANQGWTIWNVGTNIKPKYQVQRIDVFIIPNSIAQN
jgi:hypothetical protein